MYNNQNSPRVLFFQNNLLSFYRLVHYLLIYLKTKPIKKKKREKDQLLHERSRLKDLLNSLDKLSDISLEDKEFNEVFLKFHEYICRIHNKLDKKLVQIVRRRHKA